MKLRRGGVFFVLMLGLLGPARAEEWILVFDVVEQSVTQDPNGKAKPTSEHRAYTETVTLGDNYLVIANDRWLSVHDFAHRRLLGVDPVARTFTDHSLFVEPAFFEHELVNRNMLGGAMAAAKITAAADQFDRYDSETSLKVESRQLPPGTPGIEIQNSTGPDGLEFRHAGKVVVRFKPAEQRLAAAYQHRFVNYLAYGCAIHPRIRRVLAESEALPQVLLTEYRYMNRQTTATRTLRSVKSSPASAYVLTAGLKPAPEADARFAAVMTAVEAAAARTDRPGREVTVQFADQAIAGKRPLDAIMALIEYGLQSGDQIPDEIQARRDAFAQDPACQTYFKAFAQSSPAELEKSLELNRSLDRTGLTKAYMLELQRANLLERSGKAREALEGYFSVIRANPYHAGALHDLGMLYARGYEEGNAWRCWDAARKLYPRHPMMSDVNSVETDLLVRQPDFF